MQKEVLSTTTTQDGLLSSAVVKYTYEADPHKPTVTTIHVRSPSCLSDGYATRHGLSLSDQQLSHDTVDSLQAWQACASLGKDIAAGVIKSSHDTAVNMLVSGKAAGLRKLEQKASTGTDGAERFGSNKISRDDIHVPPLPHHFMHAEEVARLLTVVAPPLK